MSNALREHRQMVECLEVLAAWSARTGSPVTAAELIGAAEAERSRANLERKPDERAPGPARRKRTTGRGLARVDR